MEKKAYQRPATEVLFMEPSSMIANTSNSQVVEVSGNAGLKNGGASSASKPGSQNARGNERNGDGLSDWNIKLW